jgi:hypothetical protein
LFRKMLSKTRFVKTPTDIAIYFVSVIIASKILSDNRKIAIIAFAKKSCYNPENHIEQEAIIAFHKKLKTSFLVTPSCMPFVFQI